MSDCDCAALAQDGQLCEHHARMKLIEGVRARGTKLLAIDPDVMCGWSVHYLQECYSILDDALETAQKENEQLKEKVARLSEQQQWLDDQVDQQQQWLDEINIALGPGSCQIVTNEDRLARIARLREKISSVISLGHPGTRRKGIERK